MIFPDCEAVPTVTDHWPGRPSFFRVSSFLRLDKDDDKEYAGLKFEFSPPADCKLVDNFI